jgi:hypothetical protein
LNLDLMCRYPCYYLHRRKGCVVDRSNPRTASSPPSRSSTPWTSCNAPARTRNT